MNKVVKIGALLMLISALTGCGEISTTSLGDSLTTSIKTTDIQKEIIDVSLNYDNFPLTYTQFDLVNPTLIRIDTLYNDGTHSYKNIDINNVTGIDNITSKVGVKYFHISHESFDVDVKITVFYPDDRYNDEWRPQFHYTDEKSWLNDPNGLIYNPDTKEYHMYYQYGKRFGSDPNNVWSSRSWAHAVSRDMIHWNFEGIVIYPQTDGFGDIWSGACVADVNNSSGLFDDSTKPYDRVIAIYTVTRPYQQFCLAYSNDGGYTFTKYKGNPIIDNSKKQFGEGFRDCKIYWHEDSSYEAGGVWLMVTAGETGIRLFTSNNLLHWTFNSYVTDKNGSQIGTECPCLLRLAVDDNESNYKYVAMTNHKGYYVGDLIKSGEGKYLFSCESDQQFFNTGTNYAATQDWYLPTQPNRSILTTWIADYYMATNATDTPNRPWEGMMQLPVEAKLKTLNNKVVLYTEVVDEYQSLFDEELFNFDDFEVNHKTGNVLSEVKGQCLDIVTTIDIPKKMTSSQKFGFYLRQGNGEYIDIYYDASSKFVVLDQKYTNIASYTDMTKAVDVSSEKIKIHIILDTSAIELYVNDGEQSISSIYFIDKDNLGIEFYTINTDVHVNSMKVTSLKSAIHKHI